MLCSCIEGEEEVWVNADASGRARFKISAPTLFYSKFGGVEQVVSDAKGALADSGNARLESIETTSTGSKTTLLAEVSFQDARKIGDLLKSFRDPPDSPEKCEEEILFGDTRIDVGIPYLTFSRILDVRPLVPASSKNAMGLKMLGDSHINYTVHLPTPVKTHNADLISQDRKSLTWQVPLAQLLAEPRKMQFTAPLPNLSLYLTLTLASLLLVMAGGFALRRRYKGRLQIES